MKKVKYHYVTRAVKYFDGSKDSYFPIKSICLCDKNEDHGDIVIPRGKEMLVINNKLR